MTEDGASALTGSSINSWNSEYNMSVWWSCPIWQTKLAIHSGGHPSVMMGSCGNWTTTEWMSLLLWVVLRVSWSIPCSRVLISLPGKVCPLRIFFNIANSLCQAFSGRKLQALKNLCDTKSWQMLNVRVSIKSPIVALRFGGVQPSIAPMFTLVSKYNSIWLVSLCMPHPFPSSGRVQLLFP